MKRLITQLQDIETMKDELDEEEYASMRKVTEFDYCSLVMLTVLYRKRSIR